VLRFYDEGRSRNPDVSGGRGRGGVRLDRDFTGVRDMSDQDRADIVAFLGALTDESFERTIPERVPSGLPAGSGADLGLFRKTRRSRAATGH
jgi:cytochrome c peroxidase